MNNTKKHKLYKKFSFPININEIFIKHTIDIEFFKLYSYLIKEVYVSPNFLGFSINDQNGSENDKFSDPLSKEIMIFLKKLKTFNIQISLIFNDTFHIENYTLTSETIKVLYDNTWIDNLIVPGDEWLILKDQFFIKNSVIQIPTFNEIKSGNYDEYDEIYIHDEIIQNHDKYKELKDNKNYKFGVVVNLEDCVTHCKFKNKHYRDVNSNGFDSFIQYCPTPRSNEIEMFLKRNCIPPFLSEYLYYADVINTYKLQGRSSSGEFTDILDIIKNVHYNNNILIKDSIKIKQKLSPIDLYKWMRTKRNCSGDCPNCPPDINCDKYLINGVHDEFI